METEKSKIDVVVEHPQLQEEALGFFAQGDLKKFDGLVGEQACQIRAIMITDLYDKYVETIKKGTFCVKLLEKEECIFLVLTYFLTKFKEQGPSKQDDKILLIKRINLNRIMDFLQTTKRFTEKTLHAAQVKVAELSVNYLFTLINTKLRPFANLKPLLEQTYLAAGRPSVGAYISMMLMYYDAFENNHPIIIKVTRECNSKSNTINLIYQPNLQKKYDFEQLTPEHAQTLENKSVLIIEGKSICPAQACTGCFEHEDFLHTLQRNIEQKTLGLLRLLCANAAQHAQFVGNDAPAYDFSQTPEIEQTFLQSKEIAECEGFSLKNPSTFLIQHIYASTLEKESASFNKQNEA